jgi:osmotically inducible protein OsmC
MGSVSLTSPSRLSAVAPPDFRVCSKRAREGASPFVRPKRYVATEEKKQMPVRTSTAEWKGTIQDGNGHMVVGKGAYDGPYSFASRFEDGTGTNPEELIAAAHAGCFSMALSGALTRAGTPPTSIATTAKVHIERGDAGFDITEIELDTVGEVPGIDADAFQKAADGAKVGCPVSKALKAVKITLKATLT